MRTLVLASAFPPACGGVERFIYQLCRGLEGQLVVIAPQTPGDQQFDVAQSFEIRRVSKLPLAIPGSTALSLSISLTKELARARPDLLICAHISVAGLAYIVKKLINVDYVVFAHGAELIGSLQWVRQRLFKSAGLIVAVTHFTRSRLIDMGVNGQKIVVLNPGIDTEWFRPGYDVSCVRNKYGLVGKRVLLTVGRLAANEQYKGHDMVIRALPIVLQVIPNTVYLIVGTGDDRERLEHLARQEGVENHVIFAGFVPDDELPAYYCAADVFVMPSREIIEGDTFKYEGFGIVYLEANSCGIPVIGGRSGGVPEAVLDGVTGLLVEPTSKEAIAAAIIRLLSDVELANKLGLQGRQRVIREFDRRVIAANFEKMLKEIITKQI